MRFAFDAYVTTALFDEAGALFALGDGTVRWQDGQVQQAHEGAILCAALHPSGDGVVTGGDDGRVAWSRPGGWESLAHLPGRWIDALAVSAHQGLIAFACGRDLHVSDVKDPGFARLFTHERSVGGLAFDAKGRRLAAATYGGAALWYARIAQQKPVMLRWAGSHIGVAFDPDGKFLISSMQENALHGWRLADAADMRMGGYPAKVHSVAFVAGGAWLATSGASGVVLWPFAGAGGPMGQQAIEVGHDEHALVTRVAGLDPGTVLAAGLSDGRVWACEAGSREIRMLKDDSGPPITALAIGGARLAWGDAAGGAGIVDLPAF
jgi:WD40 repeat protein